MIGDKRIVLRAWDRNDLHALGKLRNDLALQELLMSQPRPNSIDRVQQWLLEKSENKDSVLFVIADATSDEVIGYVQVVNMSTLHGTGELGICIRPESQGHGYGSAAMALLEDYLKRIFSLRKLQLHVFSDYEAAVNFYLKLGFQEVGRMKDHFLHNSAYRDVTLMEKFLAQ